MSWVRAHDPAKSVERDSVSHSARIAVGLLLEKPEIHKALVTSLGVATTASLQVTSLERGGRRSVNLAGDD